MLTVHAQNFRKTRLAVVQKALASNTRVFCQQRKFFDTLIMDQKSFVAENVTRAAMRHRYDPFFKKL